MDERSCDETRRALALGDDVGSAWIAGHLKNCAGCRRESEQLGGLLELLAADAAHEPPPWLDARLRGKIHDLAPAFPLRPLVAAAASVGAFLAMLGGLAGVLAGSALGERGIPLAVAAGVVYLAISTAAAVPLLFHPRLRLQVALRKVQG